VGNLIVGLVFEWQKTIKKPDTEQKLSEKSRLIFAKLYFYFYVIAVFLFDKFYLKTKIAEF
jgi:hypothetical protein